MGLLLTCKHYIPPLKQRVKVDSYCIYLAKSRLVVKTKKKNKLGEEGSSIQKKIPSVFPKRNTIFCCNVLVYINCLHWLSAKTICLEELSNGYIREEHYLEFIAFACPKIIKVIQKIGPMSEICHHCNTQT